MEFTPRASTSTQIDESNNTVYCRACHRSCHKKDILRLVITGQISVTVAHMYMEDGYLKIESKTSVNLCKISPTKPELGQLFCQPNDLDTWSSIQFRNDIITPFMKRLSEYLGIDVSLINRSVQHLLSSATEVFVDFDLQTLMTVSKRRTQEVQDIMVQVFWRPLHLSKKKRENENWFDSVDCGRVIPFFTGCGKQRDYVVEENLKCIHSIQKSAKKVIAWYFSNMNEYPEEPSYSMFLELTREMENLRSGRMIIFAEGNVNISENHVIHVFRYYTNHSYDSDQYCPLVNQDTVKLFRNPFMQIKCSLPYIVESYNDHTSKYVFHMVFKDNVKPTGQNFYQLLTMLRKILYTMEIDSVVMKSCCSHKLDKVLKMIQYVLCDRGIMVTIAYTKKAPTGCGKILSFF